MGWWERTRDGREAGRAFDHGVSFELALVLGKGRPGAFRVLLDVDPFDDTRFEGERLDALIQDLESLQGLASVDDGEGGLRAVLELAKRCRAEGLLLEYTGK